MANAFDQFDGTDGAKGTEGTNAFDQFDTGATPAGAEKSGTYTWENFKRGLGFMASRPGAILSSLGTHLHEEVGKSFENRAPVPKIPELEKAGGNTEQIARAVANLGSGLLNALPSEGTVDALNPLNAGIIGADLLVHAFKAAPEAGRAIVDPNVSAFEATTKVGNVAAGALPLLGLKALERATTKPGAKPVPKAETPSPAVGPTPAEIEAARVFDPNGTATNAFDQFDPAEAKPAANAFDAFDRVAAGAPEPANTAKDTGGLTQITTPPGAETALPASTPEGVSGSAIAEAAGGQAGESVATGESASFATRAFHGTPHKVDAFSTDKIGTGEGHQVYGWGLYFAENPEVAKAYQEQLGPGRGNSERDVAARILAAVGGDEKAALAEVQRRKGAANMPDATAHFDKVADVIRKKDGLANLYDVELTPQPEDFLDWNKPLAEQPAPVLEKLQAAFPKLFQEQPMDATTVLDEETAARALADPERAARLGIERAVPAEVLQGSDLYHQLAREVDRFNKPAASAKLAALDIPGIRYLDRASRTDGAPSTTSNFVVFDGKHVKILAENGVPVKSPAEFALREDNLARESRRAELDKLQTQWKANAQRVAPGLMEKFQLKFGDPEQLVKMGRAQARDITGHQEAAYLAHEKMLFLFDRALQVRSDMGTRINLLHEMGHAFWDTLPPTRQEELTAQWQRELEDRAGPLFTKGGTLKRGVARGVDASVKEWFAERMAWANHEWARQRIEAGGPPVRAGLVGRVAQQFRQLLQQLREFVGQLRGAKLDTDFRSFLDQGERFDEVASGESKLAPAFSERQKRGMTPDEGGAQQSSESLSIGSSTPVDPITLPISTRKFQGVEDPRSRVYRGESEPPKIVSVMPGGGLDDYSRVSSSFYPMVRVTLDNGASYLDKIRISDHPQVSASAPQTYEVDIRRPATWKGTKNDWREMQGELTDQFRQQVEDIWWDQNPSGRPKTLSFSPSSGPSSEELARRISASSAKIQKHEQWLKDNPAASAGQKAVAMGVIAKARAIFERATALAPAFSERQKRGMTPDEGGAQHSSESPPSGPSAEVANLLTRISAEPRWKSSATEDPETGEYVRSAHVGNSLDILAKARPILERKNPADVSLWSKLWKLGERDKTMRDYKAAIIARVKSDAESQGWDYGWKHDPSMPKTSHAFVFYADTPEGQVSFHVSPAEVPMREHALLEQSGYREAFARTEAAQKRYFELDSRPRRHRNESELAAAQAAFENEKASLQKFADEVKQMGGSLYYRERYSGRPGVQIPEISTYQMHGETLPIEERTPIALVPKRVYKGQWSGNHDTTNILARLYQKDTASEVSHGGGFGQESSSPERLVARGQRDQNNPTNQGNSNLSRPEGDALFATRDAKDWLVRNFTSAGGLPKDVFNAKLAKDGRLAAIAKQAEFTLRDFSQAVRNVYGSYRAMTAAQLAQINDVLGGKAPTAALDPRLQAVVGTMRNQIDTLSRRLVREGAIGGELAVRIDGNVGFYLNRSYRKFDDAQWAKKVPAAVRNRAESFVAAELQAKNPVLPVDPAEVKGYVDYLLSKDVTEPADFFKSPRQGEKDLRVFTKRQEIPREIRDLLGEYTDPRVNYLRSVGKTAQVLETHAFLEDARRAGLRGGWLHDAPRTDATGQYVFPIAAEGEEAMAPLNGLFTTKEIAEAFNRQAAPGDTAWRWWLRANGWAKVAKTAFSPMTQTRNFAGNLGFLVANGHWRADAGADVWRALKADFGVGDTPANRAYLSRLTRLGVMGESVSRGELAEAVQDAGVKMTGIEDFTDSQLAKVAKAPFKAALRIYRTNDDVFKAYAFENERRAWAAADRALTGEQLDAIAAERVRNTFPTYGLIPRAAQYLRRVGLTGSFLSWPAEIIRTGYHTIGYALQDLASSNPRVRTMGAKRLAGITAMATAPWAAGQISQWLAGVNAKDDADLRRFLPAWNQNADLYYQSTDGKGRYRLIDMSYLDPYSYLKKPARAALRGENWMAALLAVAWESMSPFASEGLLTKGLLDLARNVDDRGQPVYNPQAPFLDQAMDKVAHLWQIFEPGFVTQARRIVKGARGEVSVSGRAYNVNDEAQAVLTGARSQSLDVVQALLFRAKRFAAARTAAEQLYTQLRDNRGPVDAGDLEAAKAKMEAARRKLSDTMTDDVTAAMNLGASQGEAVEALVAAGLSQTEAALVLSGVYMPYIDRGASREKTLQGAVLAR